MGRPKKWINQVKIDGSNKVIQAYSVWRHVIERSSLPYQKKYPSYTGVTHQESWLDYDVFHDWVTEQDGYGTLDKKNRLYHFDKDLIGSGKFYSEKDCVFLPLEINIAMQYSRSNSGDLPVGVSFNQGRFMVTLACDGRNKNLGRYESPEEASEIYLKAKVDRIRSLALEYQHSISNIAFDRLMNIRFGDCNV